MDNGKIDFMLIYFQKKMDNHKNNMRNTYKQFADYAKQEQTMNGESSANAIYGNALNNYLEHFQAEKEERKKEANQLRILSEYLRNMPAETAQMLKHHNKEQHSVTKQLDLVNNDILSIDALIAENSD